MVIQNEKGFFSRKMSKVISTSHTDDAFVLPENEVCAGCRYFQYWNAGLVVQTGGSPLRLTLVRLCDPRLWSVNANICVWDSPKWAKDD